MLRKVLNVTLSIFEYNNISQQLPIVLVKFLQDISGVPATFTVLKPFPSIVFFSLISVSSFEHVGLNHLQLCIQPNYLYKCSAKSIEF